MFTNQCDDGYRTPLAGVEMKTLSYGEKTLMSEFRVKGGARLPRHHHPHEQSGYLVSGRMRLTIGDQQFECAPGDAWTIPGGIEHSAEGLEDAVAIEVFSPVREDYLPAGSPSEK